jgi:hypothetical protein
MRLHVDREALEGAPDLLVHGETRRRGVDELEHEIARSRLELPINDTAGRFPLGSFTHRSCVQSFVHADLEATRRRRSTSLLELELPSL